MTEVQVNGAYDTLVFQKSDGAWWMEGEEMNPEAVENLVYAASRLSLRGILPAADVTAKGPALELLFSAGKKEAGHFFFVAAAPGYFVAAPGAEAYFEVELPGYAGLSLEKIFSGNTDHYRVHLLADLLPSEIASVEVQPWKGTAFVARQDSVYDVRVWRSEPGGEVTGEVDEHKIRMLFSYFNAIRYDRVAGPPEDVQGYIRGKPVTGPLPARPLRENNTMEVLPGSASEALVHGKLPAQAGQESSGAESLQGSLPAEPWASVAVSTFDGVRRQFDIYQWLKPGAHRPDLFEALVVYNGRPLLLVVNYYYLDLLVRGLEEYR